MESHGYSCSDIYLHTASLSHVGGLVSWLAMLKVGAQHVVMPKFSPRKVLDLVWEHRVTAMIAVPAMISDLDGLDEVSPCTLSPSNPLPDCLPTHPSTWESLF